MTDLAQIIKNVTENPSVNLITAGYLKELIQNLPDDTVVLLSGDASGNSFRPLRQVMPVKDSHWRQEVRMLCRDALPEGTETVILWP